LLSLIVARPNPFECDLLVALTYVLGVFEAHYVCLVVMGFSSTLANLVASWSCYCAMLLTRYGTGLTPLPRSKTSVDTW
jgi:hypothetical protein